MARRPDNLKTLLFTLELLKRIPRPGKVSATQLRDELASTEFARDLRTIQRQLKELSEYFDIELDDRSKPYGYRWREHATGLAVPMLRPQESLLLMLAETHLRNLLPASLTHSMESYFAQARKILGPYSSATLEREWMSKVRIVSATQPLAPPKVSPAVFAAVSEALYRNRKLDVKYRKACGKASEATVMPLGIAQQGPRLYLVCRFEGYEDERTLALHRMTSASVTIHEFERPHFDLGKYEDEGQFGFGSGKRIKLRLHIGREDGYFLLETPLSKDQTTVEHEDHLEITATVVESAQLVWWIRQFGPNARVIAPKRLARRVEGRTA